MLLRATLLGLLLSSLSMATTVFITTDQTGAQTQIDNAPHTSSWVLNVTSSGYELGGGRFEMKDGSTTVADVALTLYTGSSAVPANQIAQIVLTHSDFCTGFSNCGQFGTHIFSFSSPVPLTLGQTYFLALTSPAAADKQSNAYFIKDNGNYTPTDVAGTALNPSPFGAAPLATPEPSTMLLSGLGLVALGLIQRKVRR